MPENTISKLPESAHFVGIGGIGMSALAQMLKWQGVDVSGSDRALDNPENAIIISALKKQGVRLYPQDGSFLSSKVPSVLVYSTAIEDDNPDFQAGQEIPRIHRAEMLARAIRSITNSITIAVSGSCGKTTVTAWLAELLYLIGKDPVMIGGGLSNRFNSIGTAGNFRGGQGAYTVFEADESDKSLLQFNPDYAIILNIGTDHYSRDELQDLFRKFLQKVRKGVVVSEDVYQFLGQESFASLQVAIFADKGMLETAVDSKKKIWTVDKYQPVDGGSEILLNGSISLKLPFPGQHSALNAASILAMGEMLGANIEDAVRRIADFQGVWRRFDYAGRNPSGAKVYDDYAHNVEKIISCINTAKEVASGRVFAIFQPHGFAPLKFMRDPLFNALEKTLDKDDIFAFLPVYYAGGTSAFTPKSEEVVAGYQQSGSRSYVYFSSRKKAIKNLNKTAKESDVIAVMGARDNSLSEFAKEFIC